MMKRLIAGLVLLLALVGLCTCALADTDPIKVSIELSENKFAAPKEISVSIQVSNTGDSEMPGAVTLLYPNGKQIEEFGAPVLAAGSSKSWQGTLQVTQAQLESGRIVFPVKYPMYNEAGELINKTKNMTVLITYTGAVASVEINRTITPTTAGKGQEVTVTYDVVNSGNVDITNVTIKEHKNISSKSGTISKIPAGEKASYSFKVKMGTKNLTSQATITYKVDGKTQTAKKEAATIKYGEVYLTATATSDKKGGMVGDAVNISIKLKNSGKKDYTNVTVTDPVLGTLFTGQTVPKGETITLEKAVSIAATQDYVFTVTAKDGDGNTVEIATPSLSLTAVDPSQKINLAVNVEADRQTVSEMPGNVRFTVTVTNNGSVDVKNVTVYAVDTALYTFEKIAAGQTKTFVRDVVVSMAGQYQFVARCKDQLNETVSFQSNILPITYARPTAAPTAEPVVTPQPPRYESMPRTDDLPAYYAQAASILDVAKLVLAGLAGLCLVLGVVGYICRSKTKRNPETIVDQLDSTNTRDYEHRLTKKERDEEMSNAAPMMPEMPAAPVEEAPAEGMTGDVMVDSLAKLQTLEPQPEQVQVQEQPAEAESAEETSRRRRSDRRPE